MENAEIEAEVQELVSKINWKASREELTRELEELGSTLRTDNLVEISDAEIFSAISKDNDRDLETLIYDKLRRQADQLVSAKAKQIAAEENEAVEIVRTAHRGCCQYCLSLEYGGAYEDAPPDIWRRHGGCHCDIRYYRGGEEVEKISKSRLGRNARKSGVQFRKRKITL